ncbi:putative ATP-dependent RNA helicase ddx28 [Apophysomyces ossiformis]|uniref:Putative ATP-dependent RNA helicase ddx28 n=1 Tax=Apophysomyces ossiformis TaxID=679940 RepID=A0A8H7BWM8_9FUNG|nr:putative ATP-dependent RNA helicase ddx28 [Apophysomyces ossiformis]
MFSILASVRQAVKGEIVKDTIRTFTCSSVAHTKRAQLRKPNISTLTKHLKPDGMTGRQRRDALKAQLKRNRPRGEGPYIPVKRRLEEIGPITKVKELTNFLSTQTFDDLGLSSDTIDAARSVLPEEARPTEIQALAIPKLVQSKSQHVLVAAETGSGKTLAYLLPMIHQLKQEESEARASFKRRLDHPRGIVLVPTRELVSQVIKTCKSLAHIVKFRALDVTSRTPRHILLKRLADSPVDVLVTTPTTLRSYLESNTLSVADMRVVVMDEADSLFDAGWGEDCKAILRKAPSKAKVVIVSATLPRSVHSALDQLFPDLLKITTPSLHKALPNLKQSFVDLERFAGNRQMALLEVLKKNIKDDKTLIFCNTKKSVEILHNWLKSKNVPALALYKDAEMSREEALSRFQNEDNVLISTDIASRGIDTTFVDHVVLFDFPTSVVDYLHRVGRTARAGRKGKTTSLIGRKDRMMADRIRRAIREGSVLT